MQELNIFSDMCFNEKYIRSFIKSNIELYLASDTDVSSMITNTPVNPVGYIRALKLNIGSYTDVIEVLKEMGLEIDKFELQDQFGWVHCVKNPDTTNFFPYFTIGSNLKSSGFVAWKMMI